MDGPFERNTNPSLQNSTNFDKNADLLDHQIVECLIAQPGLADKDIARKLGVSRATINKRRKHGGAKFLLESTFKLKQETLKRLAIMCLKKLEQHVGDSDPRISIAACGLILRSVETLRAIADVNDDSGLLQLKFGWGD